MVRKSKRFMVLALAAVLAGNEAVLAEAASGGATMQIVQEQESEEETEPAAEVQETEPEKGTEEETKEESTTQTETQESTEEVTEEVTEEETTQEETETQEVTDTKKNRKALAKKVQSNENEITYSMEELTQTQCWGAKVTFMENGSAQYQFPKQYNQLSLLIPEEVDLSRLQTIICNAQGDTGYLSLKTYADKGMQEETSVTYGNSRLSVDSLSPEKMCCVGIMSLADDYEIQIDSITFVLADKKEESGGVNLKPFAKDASNNNPIVTQRYSADPGVMVYDDTVYVYTTNDIYEYRNGEIVENTYADITTLNCFSSKDMVNWTDHGTIQAAGKSGAAVWAKNSWAPCAASKKINGKDKFFLYFADNGGGIGVLTADSPTGPWTDPLGKGLITRSTPNCSNVEWLFDPAVLVDDDGTGYLYFGGGVPKGKEANPGTARVVKLGDDMISLACDPVTIEPPYLFEDSGINKIDGKYYYSYCSNWNTSGSGYATAAIEYMVSDNPMGPFTYAGEMFKNPGVYFDVWGNNHHSLFEFKDKYYLAYHARALETEVLGTNLGYRSTQIDTVTIENGEIKNVIPTMTGVSQLEKVNPYEKVEAECIARELGVEVAGCGNTTVKAQSGDWTCVKGVDFEHGVSEITLSLKTSEATTVEIRTGSSSGTLLGTVEVENTNGSFEEFAAKVKNVTGEKNLFFVFRGDVEFDYWQAAAGNVYTFDKLKEVMSYDLQKEISKDGSMKLSYDKKYAEIRFEVPESVDTSKLNKLVLNLKSGDKATLSMKLLSSYDPAKEEAVGYGVSELGTEKVENPSSIKYFGIMALEDEADFEITSVEFVMKADNTKEDENELVVQTDVPDLKDVIAKKTDNRFITGVSITHNELNDKNLMALVTKHFNAVTFGNELKPDCLFGYSSKCPEKETATLNGVTFEVPSMDYSRPEKMLDTILAWNEEHPQDKISVRGHVLVWHSQTPEWFFHEDYDASKPYVDKKTMTLRQEWYIKTVLTHFTGKDSKYKELFYGWDVVNEAVSDGRGTYRNGDENSSWWKVYGSNEFIINAFRFANKYAPAELELYYNDYNEWVTSKVSGIVQLLKDVKNADGTRIDGMGMQGHYQTDGSPSIDEFKKAARAYADVVDKIQITELDMKASNTYDGTVATQDAEYTKQAYRYKQLYEAILDLRAEGVNISNMTIWGVIDKNSWLQTSNAVGGASDGKKRQCPLLFDDDYQVKPAYWAFADDTKLEPEIKKIDIIQTVNDAYSAGNQITLSDGNATAVLTPEWTEKGLNIQVKVEDAKKSDTDAVIVYVSVNGKIEKQTLLRKDAKETAGGYEAQIIVPCDNSALQVASEILVDFVLVNDNTKTAYNDYTMNQDNSDKYYAKAVLKPYTVIRKGTVTVDGKKDSQWDKAVEVPLTINLGSKTEAKAKLLWDEDNLYVYVDVTDSVLNSDSANAHEKDSVEVFIDENNHKSDSYEDDDKQYRINYLNEHSFNGTKCEEENVQSKVTLTETGYVVEAAFAWTDITPVDGTEIGLELQINDADASGKRIGTLSWYDTSGSGWSNPGVFGTAVLKNETTQEPDKPQKPSQSESSKDSQDRGESQNTQSENQQTIQVTPVQNIIEEQVLMASGILPGNDTYVNIIFSEKKALLNQALLYKYRGQKLMLMTHLGNGVGYSMDASEIHENAPDLNLAAAMKVISNFAEGFDSFRLEPEKSAALTWKIGVHLNVGKQYTGKMAYIFQKNLISGEYEPISIMPVNEIGNVILSLQFGRSIVQSVFRRTALFILLKKTVKCRNTGKTGVCCNFCNGKVRIAEQLFSSFQTIDCHVLT